MADLGAGVSDQLLNRLIGVTEIDFEHRVPLQAQVHSSVHDVLNK